MNKVFGLVKQIDSRPEFSKNGSRPIFAAKRHENSMKPIFQRNKSTIRRAAFLLLFSMLLSFLTVFPSFAEGSGGEVTPRLPDTALTDASVTDPSVNIETEPMQNEVAITAVISTPVRHETAHTLGIDDVYDNVGHDVDNGFRCVMERFDKEYANEYYENVLSGVEDPFCPSCLSKMKKLVPNTFYPGNQGG